MLVNDKIAAAFNAQIGHEFGNELQYLAIAAYFDAERLFGLAKIFYKQAHEEHEHGMKFIKFLLDADADVEIPASPAPRNGFSSAEDAAQAALDLETKTTNLINGLMDLAIAEKNYMAQIFLQWFVTEQLEEMASATDRLAVIKRAGPNVLMVEAYIAHNAG